MIKSAENVNLSRFVPLSMALCRGVVEPDFGTEYEPVGKVMANTEGVLEVGGLVAECWLWKSARMSVRRTSRLSSFLTQVRFQGVDLGNYSTRTNSVLPGRRHRHNENGVKDRARSVPHEPSVVRIERGFSRS